MSIMKHYYGIGPVKKISERKITIYSLFISLKICFGCSKEPSHRDGSFECPTYVLHEK